jgi:hypothetical protein
MNEQRRPKPIQRSEQAPHRRLDIRKPAKSADAPRTPLRASLCRPLSFSPKRTQYPPGRDLPCQLQLAPPDARRLRASVPKPALLRRVPHFFQTKPTPRESSVVGSQLSDVGLPYPPRFRGGTFHRDPGHPKKPNEATVFDRCQLSDFRTSSARPCQAHRAGEMPLTQKTKRSQQDSTPQSPRSRRPCVPACRRASPYETKPTLRELSVFSCQTCPPYATRASTPPCASRARAGPSTKRTQTERDATRPASPNRDAPGHSLRPCVPPSPFVPLPSEPSARLPPAPLAARLAATGTIAILVLRDSPGRCRRRPQQMGDP